MCGMKSVNERKAVEVDAMTAAGDTPMGYKGEG